MSKVNALCEGVLIWSMRGQYRYTINHDSTQGWNPKQEPKWESINANLQVAHHWKTKESLT